MNKSLIILLTLLMSSYSTLSSAPLGTPPQFNAEAQKTEKLKDGQSIVLGKFKSRQDADFQLSSLLDFMDSSSKIVNLELAHGFDYAVKEENGLYVVSIEPFVSDDVLNDVLETVKTRYPKAHAEVCIECVREELLKAKAQQNVDQEQELLENAIALEEGSGHIEVRVEEEVVAEDKTVKAEPTSVDQPFKTEYIFYGVGALALLLLFFLVMRKPKKSSDKELREMYAQAQELEKEMVSETEESSKATHEEVTTSNEPVVPDEVVPVKERAVTPKAASKPEAKVAPEPVVKVQPSGELKHKLREPNRDIGSVTKENFKEFEGLRLLIAEDNLINQKVIVGLLKESGINIKIANDGQECLEILAEDPNYPIILMDAHMPRIDGLEATRQIRANPAYNHITVMALSGDTGADDVRKMRECGMEEQLEKPLKVAALYQALYCYFDPNILGGPVDDLPEIHLDNALGLEMLGGDIELYNEILSEFQSLYHDSDEKIEIWLKHEDYDRAKALLLDVKGIGESIGTPELTQTAEEFREALIANESDKYAQLLKLYRSQLQSILADIAEV
ncbi:MAG: response regulator [Sulfurimonadaceae bacterium]